MVGTYAGTEFDFQTLGANAGFPDGSVDGDMATITVMVPADSTFSYFIVALLNMPKWLIQPNSTVPITGEAVSGFFIRANPSTGDFQLMGFIGGTDIQFRDAGTNPDDAIDATIRLEIWGGGGGGNDYGSTPKSPKPRVRQSGRYDVLKRYAQILEATREKPERSQIPEHGFHREQSTFPDHHILYGSRIR